MITNKYRKDFREFVLNWKSDLVIILKIKIQKYIKLLGFRMAARDIYHNTVRAALEKDNWKITDDPLTLKIGRRAAMVDLGAEKLLAAEREKQKIAIEIKSFLNPSPLYDLERALGQFILFNRILERQEPDRTLYLAVNQPVFKEIFSEEVGQLLLETTDLRLMVFAAKTEEIVKWIL